MQRVPVLLCALLALTALAALGVGLGAALLARRVTRPRALTASLRDSAGVPYQVDSSTSGSCLAMRSTSFQVAMAA